VEVGSAFVRIRPFVDDRDLRALAALHQLCRGIDAAFETFYDALAADAALPEGERDAA
jgi:hypothetical protein